MSSSSESMRFLRETFLCDDPLEATSKRANTVPPYFERSLRRSLRQAIVGACRLIDEDTDEEEEERKNERVRPPSEEAETSQSSSADRSSGYSPREGPPLEQEEDERVPQSPSDMKPSILRTS
ncbi:UNVERIFIED_CONTAM: hypothetical protein Sindi_1817500 [Sesamum indicum]